MVLVTVVVDGAGKKNRQKSGVVLSSTEERSRA
jgi:hypothetical protein